MVHTEFLLVGAGGALGAWARFGLGRWVAAHTLEKTFFPWGTFVINISGSFALGLFMTLAERNAWHPYWRFGFAIGFLGAYTTFSTFEYESMQLLLEGQTGLALRNLIASVVVGLFGVWLGIALARLMRT